MEKKKEEEEKQEGWTVIEMQIENIDMPTFTRRLTTPGEGVCCDACVPNKQSKRCGGFTLCHGMVLVVTMMTMKVAEVMMRM